MLVVSVDSINRQPLVIVVAVGTDGAHVARDFSTNVRVSAVESGLPNETVFLGFQLRSLDPRRFGARAGRLPPERLLELDEALRRVLGL